MLLGLLDDLLSPVIGPSLHISFIPDLYWTILTCKFHSSVSMWVGCLEDPTSIRTECIGDPTSIRDTLDPVIRKYSKQYVWMICTFEWGVYVTVNNSGRATSRDIDPCITKGCSSLRSLPIHVSKEEAKIPIWKRPLKIDLAYYWHLGLSAVNVRGRQHIIRLSDLSTNSKTWNNTLK